MVLLGFYKSQDGVSVDAQSDALLHGIRSEADGRANGTGATYWLLDIDSLESLGSSSIKVSRRLWLRGFWGRHDVQRWL